LDTVSTNLSNLTTVVSALNDEVDALAVADIDGLQTALDDNATADRARSNHTGTHSADTLTDGTTNKAFLATERTKLAGVATGATANSSDATLLARANHTGTQSASTISDFNTAADARVGAAVGSTVQGYDADTAAIAALTPSNDDIIQRKGGVWTNRTIAQLKTDLALQFEMVVAVSDETTAITTGAAKVTFRMPRAVTLTKVRASLSTASSSGLVTVDVNEGGVSIFSTTLTIDANEKTSESAATAAVLSDTAIADDAEITIDIDGAGTGAKGLKVTFLGVRA
jgi:hypothetical protein